MDMTDEGTNYLNEGKMSANREFSVPYNTEFDQKKEKLVHLNLNLIVPTIEIAAAEKPHYEIQATRILTHPVQTHQEKHLSGKEKESHH